MNPTNNTKSFCYILCITERTFPITLKLSSSPNGPEFRSFAVQQWCKNHEVTQVFSRPGKPTDNCFIEIQSSVS